MAHWISDETELDRELERVKNAMDALKTLTERMRRAAPLCAKKHWPDDPELQEETTSMFLGATDLESRYIWERLSSLREVLHQLKS